MNLFKYISGKFLSIMHACFNGNMYILEDWGGKHKKQKLKHVAYQVKI